MINSFSTTTTTSTNTSTSSSSTSTIINGCYQMIAISHLLSVTRYLLLAKCHLSSFVFYLKLPITCKNLFSFALCCMSCNFYLAPDPTTKTNGTVNRQRPHGDETEPKGNPRLR